MQFNLSLQVNEVVLYEYNAPKDPFLYDYFQCHRSEAAKEDWSY
jgi:hypothetical protein